jgi:hypothetical protein
MQNNSDHGNLFPESCLTLDGCMYHAPGVTHRTRVGYFSMANRRAPVEYPYLGVTLIIKIWIRVHGSWIMDHGAWIMVHGPGHMTQGS